MSESTYLTQEEATEVCGKSRDTIRRYRRDGKLPNSRTRADGAIEVAVADLVSAGLLDPLAANGPVREYAGRSRIERDLAAARHELVVANVRLDALTCQLERADAEVAFLRSLPYGQAGTSTCSIATSRSWGCSGTTARRGRGRRPEPRCGIPRRIRGRRSGRRRRRIDAAGLHDGRVGCRGRSGHRGVARGRGGDRGLIRHRPPDRAPAGNVRHPGHLMALALLPAHEHQPAVIGTSLLATLAIVLVLGKVGKPMQAASGRGILSLEFARTKKQAEDVMIAWGHHGRRAAVVQTLLDFAFILAYVTLAGLLCTYVAVEADVKNWASAWSTIGDVLAGVAVVAGLFDR